MASAAPASSKRNCGYSRLSAAIYAASITITGGSPGCNVRQIEWLLRAHASNNAQTHLGAAAAAA